MIVCLWISVGVIVALAAFLAAFIVRSVRMLRELEVEDEHYYAALPPNCELGYVTPKAQPSPTASPLLVTLREHGLDDEWPGDEGGGDDDPYHAA